MKRRGRRGDRDLQGRADAADRISSPPTSMPTEAAHGGTDLSRRGGPRHRPGDGARPRRRLPRRGRRPRPAACSRPRSGSTSSSAPMRVRDTPISEQAILGAAMGAAMTGLKPIAEIMFSDFFAVCFDYIANEFAKSRYMSNGQLKCPLVVRTGNGAGSRFGAQHSQSVENWAMMIPGLKVVAPSTPRDVIGLLAAAVRDPDPVIFFEHKSLYPIKGEVPDGEIVDTLGHGEDRAARQGRHHPRARLDGAARARGGREAQGGTRHRLRGGRRALAGAARHPDDPRLGRRAPTGCSRSRRIRGCAAGAPRSCRSSPTRRSTISTARRCGSRRRTFRCRPPTFWRTSRCRRSTASSTACGGRCRGDNVRNGFGLLPLPQGEGWVRG